MNALEQFFLSHPDLMRFHFDSRPWIWFLFALLSLCLPFAMRGEQTSFQVVAPPIGALRCFRFCWLAGFPAMVIEAISSARGVQLQSWMLGLQAFCYLLWLVLFVVGIGGILRACFREARAQRADSTSS